MRLQRAFRAVTETAVRAELSSGDLARATGNTVRTVRFYEEQGLLKPAVVSCGGHRRYTRETLEGFLHQTRTTYEERQFVSPAERTFLLPQFIAPGDHCSDHICGTFT